MSEKNNQNISASIKEKVVGAGKYLKNNWKKISLAIVGLVAMGIGVAINNISLLGNDPVSVFYDGIAFMLRIPLNIASTWINIIMFAIAFLLARKYVKLASVLYLLFLSPFIGVGMDIFAGMVFKVPKSGGPQVLAEHMNQIFATNPMLQVGLSVVGCIIMFTGLALFVALNLGVDPWNALAFQTSDKFNLPYKYVKIGWDVSVCVIGMLLHGVWGVTTIVTALVGGPYIKVVSGFISRTLLKWCKIETENTEEKDEKCLA